MPWIEVNGVSLHYTLDGPEDGPTLMLVHELGGTLDSWQETLPTLAGKHRVLRWDWRGAGLSEKIRGELSIETMVADMAGLLDALKLKQPISLVGTALGGGVAIAFAAREGSRVERLVPTNPATGYTPETRGPLLERAEGVERDGMRAYAESSLDRSWPDPVRKDPDLFEWYRLRWIANDPASFAAHNRMLGSMNEDENCPRISCPTLVLCGIHDVLRPPDKVKPIAAAIPGARYEDVDSGHFMAVQSPKTFLKHIMPFLEERL